MLPVIEGSNTTLAYDRGAKLAAYATSGIGEYWIVNLRDRTVEVHAQPRDGRFQSTRIARGDDRVTPRGIPDVSFTVAEMFGTIARG
ncbi:hypothetical protein WPS_20930 [Vulcanimicrobium alpinum]|uniref:Putative restriction endonuclease domain-containing protein n=1 Tax=Vulcanimicrobium alpinum TaxID=3016050 RepID=A0AAN1XZ08_UNVUL|nr:hypothetical protein WPS_20930 [Vulcanimicrobium alpinum]